jgi:hypothetical protein
MWIRQRPKLHEGGTETAGFYTLFLTRATITP